MNPKVHAQFTTWPNPSWQF